MSKRCGDIPGGGFIVLDGQSWREFLDSPMNDPTPIRILILELANGIWDLPKGRQDSGESHLTCAIR